MITLKSKRQCFNCMRYKLPTEFSPNRFVKSGLQRTCHDCDAKKKRELRAANPEKYKIAKKASYASPTRATGETRAEYIRLLTLNKYNLTVEQFHAFLEKQKNSCGICKNLFDLSNGYRNCHIDHEAHPADTRNKAYGKVRGLLCNSCNNGIGRFIHDPERLRNAADYLERCMPLEEL